MKTKAHLGELDLEVLNPIETKKIIGGNWYDYHDIQEVIIWGNSGGGDYGDWWGYDPTHGGNDYPSDWGGGGSGGNGGVDTAAFGGDLTTAEIAWLLSHPGYFANMLANKLVAEQFGQNQHNGPYDALRHALWSALDAHDLGVKDAKEFHTLHETEHWNPVESPSDLINNQWGYNWAQQHGDPDGHYDQFLADFWAAVNNGQISVIP